MYSSKDFADRIREAYHRKEIIILNFFEKSSKENDKLLEKYDDAEILRHFSMLSQNKEKEEIKSLLEVLLNLDGTSKHDFPAILSLDFKSITNTVVVEVTTPQLSKKVKFPMSCSDDLNFIADIVYYFCEKASLFIQ